MYISRNLTKIVSHWYVSDGKRSQEFHSFSTTLYISINTEYFKTFPQFLYFSAHERRDGLIGAEEEKALQILGCEISGSPRRSTWSLWVKCEQLILLKFFVVIHRHNRRNKKQSVRVVLHLCLGLAVHDRNLWSSGPGGYWLRCLA